MSQPISTTTFEALNGRSPSRRTVARRRISSYLTEPLSAGNTLVGLSDGTQNVAHARAAHEKRVAAELAKVNDKLP